MTDSTKIEQAESFARSRGWFVKWDPTPHGPELGRWAECAEADEGVFPDLNRALIALAKESV